MRSHAPCGKKRWRAQPGPSVAHTGCLIATAPPAASRAANAARHMSSTGAGTPSTAQLRRRLMHQHAQTVHGGRAGRGGRREPGRRARRVDKIGRHLPVLQQRRRDQPDSGRDADPPASVRPCLRSGVDNEIRLPAPPSSPGSAGRPARPASAATSMARSGVRFTTVTTPPHLQPERAPRLGPLPGPDDDAPLARGVEPGAPGQRGQEACAIGVLPRRLPSRLTTQLTAPSRSATSLRASTRAATSALWACHRQPGSPSARIPSSAGATCPGATSNATEAQLRPSAANAVLWRSGDSECRTG